MLDVSSRASNTIKGEACKSTEKFEQAMDDLRWMMDNPEIDKITLYKPQSYGIEIPQRFFGKPL